MNYDECHEKIPNITSVIPAKAGIQSAEIQIHKLNTNKFSDWIPAFAGMTTKDNLVINFNNLTWIPGVPRTTKNIVVSLLIF